MNPELKSAHDDVLFWSRRLSYHSSDKHPEWRENYIKAKERLKKVKEKLESEKYTTSK
jgi:hypothetical protein